MWSQSSVIPTYECSGGCSWGDNMYGHGMANHGKTLTMYVTSLSTAKEITYIISFTADLWTLTEYAVGNMAVLAPLPPRPGQCDMYGCGVAIHVKNLSVYIISLSAAKEMAYAFFLVANLWMMTEYTVSTRGLSP